jgi:hypothetical protein
MMNLARPFKIQNGMNIYLNNLEDLSYPRKGVMARPCISVVVGIERFTPCKNDLCSFHSHYAILEV